MLQSMHRDLSDVWPSVTTRRCAQVCTVAVIFLATAAVAGPSHGGRPGLETSARPVIAVVDKPKPQEVSIDIMASFSGQCSALKIAGRDFACRAVKYFHSPQGRTYFTIAVDDPADGSHVISFSGENARREKDTLYELTIDRMLLNSKDRPKVDGLRVPLVELSTGTCTQLGDFAARQISSIACIARDRMKKHMN